MWRDLIDELGFVAASPASEEAIAAAEAPVGCRLPESLRGFLRETNGVLSDNGVEVVMSAERIANDNRQMRTFEGFDELYMPFDPLLVFGDSGNGDLFAFAIRADRASDQYVFVWDHEDDSRMTTAAGLERYLRGERWHEHPG